MGYQRRAILLYVFIITALLEKGNCYDYDEEYIRKHDLYPLPPLPESGTYHKNSKKLPEKAIYCTNVKMLNEGKGNYVFLNYYYSSILGNPDYYTHKLECIYPRSVEFPELGDVIVTTPKPKLTGLELFQQSILEDSKNFGAFLDKVNKGEKPEPFKFTDAQAITDQIMNDIFHNKPDPFYQRYEDSAPNGIICEHLQFNENDIHGMKVQKIRPICYPATRPPPTTTTTTTTTTTASPDIIDRACYALCHTGVIYQLLSCCRK